MISSTVKAVRFYRRGFAVEAEGQMKLEKGRQTVRIADIVSGIDDSTIRLFLPEGIYGSNVQLRYLDEEEKKKTVSKIEEEIEKVNSKIGIYEKMNEVWLNNADFSQKENIASMAEYMEKLPLKLEETANKISELRKQLEELNKKLEEETKKANLPFVTVDVETENETECPFRLNYYCNNAYWQPEYELHTDEDNNEITIRLKARIRQNTTTDLKDVKVSLYTGNPSVSGTIPTLYPRYVNIYQPRTMAYGGMAKNAGAQPMMSMMMEDAAAPVEEAEMDYAVMAEAVSYDAKVNYGDTMMEYELNGTWNIKKNEDFICELSASKANCRYHIVSVPLMDESAYLAAEVNTSDLEDLINTEAAVYQKGAYMGKVYLAVDLTKEKYDISLGKDETIKVKRTQVRKHTSNVLLKAQKKTEYEFEINVNSTKPKACEVTVLDQIPVSQDKSIVIERKDISSAVYKEETGELKWDFSIEPGASKRLKLAYDVAWPKDKTINY